MLPTNGNYNALFMKLFEVFGQHRVKEEDGQSSKYYFSVSLTNFLKFAPSPPDPLCVQTGGPCVGVLPELAGDETNRRMAARVI